MDDETGRALELLAGRFACPVGWCAGGLLEHGGDGAEPGEWIHAGRVEALPAGGCGQVLQQAGGPAVYDVALTLDGSHGPAWLEALAGELRELAGALAARAADILAGRL